MRWFNCCSSFCVIGVLLPAPAPAYSVLTHEAIIDSAWPNELRPASARAFPQRYRGPIARSPCLRLWRRHHPGHGLLPIRKQVFQRSRPLYAQRRLCPRPCFKDARESQDLNDYAFALGALAHYAADNLGHPVAVNRTVPLVYPKLRAKFGPEITYEDNPAAHLKTEFGFDVVEVARGQYASEAYHDFIGFQVAKPLSRTRVPRDLLRRAKGSVQQPGSRARHLSLHGKPSYSRK